MENFYFLFAENVEVAGEDGLPLGYSDFIVKAGTDC